MRLRVTYSLFRISRLESKTYLQSRYHENSTICTGKKHRV